MLAIEELERLIKHLPRNAKVLDVGCGQGQICDIIFRLRSDIKVHGTDKTEPKRVPNQLSFRTCNFEHEKIPFEANSFDLVICQHVIEHLYNSVNLFGELVRVAKCGGNIFVEAPSDHSLWFSFPWAQNWRLIMSYYDDPTHVGRPWTPQGLYRLGLFWGVRPESAKYEFSLVKLIFFIPLMLIGWLRKNPDLIVSTWWQATGWVCFSTFTKPETTEDEPTFSYASYKGHPPL
ncbi:class I SAM-dependent methyltransferase [Thalassospira lucentensis]|uniref:class I SAM-dependent methyltransferase n=1 Tax=Thalassospira lucentensis TaxID=168935 RepID=UPI00142D350D|nr:class I SAM-dependent methyltransferase [Thalassospira lucentensis]